MAAVGDQVPGRPPGDGLAVGPGCVQLGGIHGYHVPAPLAATLHRAGYHRDRLLVAADVVVLQARAL